MPQPPNGPQPPTISALFGTTPQEVMFTCPIATELFNDIIFTFSLAPALIEIHPIFTGFEVLMISFAILVLKLHICLGVRKLPPFNSGAAAGLGVGLGVTILWALFVFQCFLEICFVALCAHGCSVATPTQIKLLPCKEGVEKWKVKEIIRSIY